MTRNSKKAVLAMFMKNLRKMGFKRGYYHRDSGCRIYERLLPSGRKLDVQLWSDGNHRANHSHNGAFDTYPTDFRTLREMKAVIVRETLRMDSVYAPGNEDLRVKSGNEYRAALGFPPLPREVWLAVS